MGAATTQAAGKTNKLRSPWTKNKSSRAQPPEYKTSVPKLVFDSYIGFFQRYISPVDGVRCQLYPTCSQYGRRTVRKHGAILGFVMIAGRLMRCNGGVPQHYPLMKKYKRFFFYDPLDANDFWWLQDELRTNKR